MFDRDGVGDPKQRTTVVLFSWPSDGLALPVFSPVVEAEDDDWNYTVSRVSGMRDFIPLVGLVHHVTGEPVWLRRTNKQTGEVVVRGYDLVSDIQDEYPLMRGAPYSKRLLDSPR